MIPIGICEKLLRLAAGEALPASTLKHVAVTQMLEDGIILTRLQGRTKAAYYIPDVPAFEAWLYNQYAIANLAEYLQVLKNETASRADLVQYANDSKAKSVRSYKGFLVNSYVPIGCTLNGTPFTVSPAEGSFQFVYDYEAFIPSPEVVIVGVENMENFRQVANQRYLFEGTQPLFICRYPQEQGRDMIKWLSMIPNNYVHFGDFDFAGISIYLREFRKHLGYRASFFIPPGIDELLGRYGNPLLYDKQVLDVTAMNDPQLQPLIALLHKHKKGLEQEVFIRR